MTRVLRLVALGTVVWAAPAVAQEQRLEASVLLGWAFSESVDGGPVITGDGNVYNRVDPKDSFKWGLSGGVLVDEGAEVGFMFGQQRSTLEASGTNTIDGGDMTVNTYHGYFAYNFLDADATVRPYLIVGLGTTHFSSVSTSGATVRRARLAAKHGLLNVGDRRKALRRAKRRRLIRHPVDAELHQV